MIIYKATNLVNGKVYIGQTIKTLESRQNGHCYDNPDVIYEIEFKRRQFKKINEK